MKDRTCKKGGGIEPELTAGDYFFTGELMIRRSSSFRDSLRYPGAGLRFSKVILTLCCCMISLQGCAFLYKEATVAYVEVNSHFSSADIEIEIHKSFIERYKNRVTIATTFRVDQAWEHPNPPFMDGDFHFAGRTPQVGLPTVGEIVNAASEKGAVDLIHLAEKTGRPLGISGVWRLWPEHAGTAEEEQGEKLQPVESSNPGHVFELHPVTRIEDLYLLDSFHPVKGFSPGDAQTVFRVYEGVQCVLRVKSKTVSLVTRKGLYNDVEFLMEIADDHQAAVDDGRFVTADVRDLKGNLLVKGLRMVFMKDTPPEKAVKNLRRGDRLHVYGIPRVDFAEISRRIENYRAHPELRAAKLPYEIIIIGFLPSS
jgi:hypothetical protein